MVAAKGVEVGLQTIHLPAQGTAKDMMTEWTSIIATHRMVSWPVSGQGLFPRWCEGLQYELWAMNSMP